MTNETTSNITIRSLTVKEMRELRKAGYDPAFVGMVDWILDHVYAEQITDDMPYSEALRIATDTYAKTYGREVETKN